MKWASSISETRNLEGAVEEAAAGIRKELGGATPDLLCLFVSREFADRYEEVGALVSDKLPARLMMGCSAGGVIGAGREVEEQPGLSLVAAALPGVELRAFAVQDEDLPDMDASPRAWEDLAGVKASEKPHFLLLADPFSIRMDDLVMGLDYAFPKAVKVGGLASGAEEPGRNALYMNDLCLRSGAAGVALLGDIDLDAVVAQGCRPIGRPFTVTDCQQNVLLELDHKPPLETLQDVAASVPERDRELMRNALFLGLAIDPAKGSYERGDFLVRNIVGLDRERGYLAIGALLRKGQTVQFHLRDAETSAEDLRLMLGRFAALKGQAKGALLFSCVGRGRTLYGRPDHDSRMFLHDIGPVPLGGFFCNGEIGPVGGTTYLHGYTSCFGLFRSKG